MRRTLKFLWLYISLSVAAAIGLALVAFPYLPRSAAGWGVFLLLALPITLAGEALGAHFFKNRLAEEIESRTTGRPVSALRILYLLLVMLLVFGTSWWLVIKLGLKP